MILQNQKFDHSQETIHGALNVPREIMITCRERIFFCHFANSLQSIELFPNRDEAPKQLTTVSGDLERVLNMTHDPLEYEITLLNFNMYQKMAGSAFSQWQMENDKDSEHAMKIQLLRLLHKLKEASDKGKEKDGEDDIVDEVDGKLTEENVVQRVELVKKSKYNFSRYMQLVGFPLQGNNDSNFDVDGLINGLFD
jgi:hypothetical protein